MAEKTVWFQVSKHIEEGSYSSSSSSASETENGTCISMQTETSDGEPLMPLSVSVQTSEGETMKQLSAKVLGILQLTDTGFVLQLRNHQCSLIPLNGKLEENTEKNPYHLTIFKQYQSVTPKPRSIQADNYSSTIHNHIQMFLSRISNLENSIPELTVKREEKIKQEIRELEDKLNFLQKRFNEADKMEWTGIIKKSPLW